MRRIRAPDGAEHSVQIEWIGGALRRAPDRTWRRVRTWWRAMAHLDPIAGVDSLSALGGVLVGALVLLIVLLLAPLPVGALEAAAICLLAGGVWATKIVLHRPWKVSHRGPDADELASWRVVGWREAHRVMVEAARSVEVHGQARVTPPVAGWADDGDGLPRPATTDSDETRRRRLAATVRRHRLLATAAALVLVVVATSLAAIGWVQGSTRGDVYAVDDVPAAPVAIVLGAGLRRDGTPSPYLRARLTDALALYRADKVEAILVSGDHGRPGYDEVGAMRRWLVEREVPAKKVVSDHAGFDTYDSCQRARRIFGVEDAIVVTQGFHAPRAVFLCRQAGIRTVGVAAPAVGGHPALNRLRELPASAKAALDAVVDPGPRYLGPPEPGIRDALDE